MNYVVFDMEWNQPLSVKRRITKPVELFGEIVQIGAVKLDEHYRILDTFKIMVSPKHYTKMNRNVAKLTKITTKELQYGLPFPAAFKHFRKWCGSEFTFLTWGADDINMLRDNMLLHGLDTDWIPDTYNLQLIFDDQITKEKRQISLTQAMEMLGAPALEAHDALNDAKNTACICQRLDMTKGLSEYPSLLRQLKSKHSDAPQSSKAGKTYATRLEAISDAEVICFDCPTCGKKMICEGIVRQNTGRYICIGNCENGDVFFVRLNIRKQSDGKYSANRTLYNMDEERKAYYLIQKELKENKSALSGQQSFNKC